MKRRYFASIGGIKAVPALFFIALAGLASTSFGQEAPEHVIKPYNVVLIVVSALRADHLGCYGYSHDTSPNITGLAKDGVLFENAVSQSYWTLPSMVSIFTSRFVSGHGVNSRHKRLGAEEKTLAEVLKGQGYLTMGFTCGLDTVPAYGLDRGFDIYESYRGKKPVGSFSDIMPAVFDVLKRDGDKKFFLFVQSYDVHPPYIYGIQDSFDKGYDGIFKGMTLDYNIFKQIRGGVLYSGGRQSRLSERDLSYIVASYDDGIRYADRFIGSLIDKLKELKLYDRTIIILCADHGEELGERGTFNRFGNQNLYQEVIHVPFIIMHPDALSANKRVKPVVGTVDIMPTILDFLDVASEGLDMQGISLAALVSSGTGVVQREFIISEASKDKWALVWQDGWKFLRSAEDDELYNIAEDPKELNNMSAKNLEKSVISLQKFFLLRERSSKEGSVRNRAELTPDLIENLRKAGYW